jgi:D-alanyl-D-alanine carboxypeptidase (penicillin-binding protein 5/6)
VVFLRAQRYPLDQWQQAAQLLDWGYALPRGTAVGHLDSPPPPKVSSTPRTSRTTAPRAVGPPLAWRSARSSNSNPWPLIGIALAVVTAGTVWIGRRLTGRG